MIEATSILNEASNLENPEESQAIEEEGDDELMSEKSSEEQLLGESAVDFEDLADALSQEQDKK